MGFYLRKCLNLAWTASPVSSYLNHMYNRQVQRLYDFLFEHERKFAKVKDGLKLVIFDDKKLRQVDFYSCVQCFSLP